MKQAPQLSKALSYAGLLAIVILGLVSIIGTGTGGGGGGGGGERRIFSLPDTGQIACYDADGSSFNRCPLSGQPFYGQDACYSISPPSYTKLDAGGNALPDNAAAWVMVKDNVTGLIWEVKTDDGGIHHKDSSYSWFDAEDVFIAQLNADQFGGHDDWRMPTREELKSIVNYGIYNPAIDSDFFPNTKSDYYWSSTPFSGAPVSAWRIDFYDGSDYNGYGSDEYYVRAVRGEQTESSDNLVINVNGTVSDQHTGLVWMQDTAATAMTWQEALAWCENLSLAGYSDWRLPNINELSSIVDCNTYDPAIATAFPNTVPASYWSSTTCDLDRGSAWIVNFRYGHASDNDKTTTYYVRAVRGGPAGGGDNGGGNEGAYYRDGDSDGYGDPGAYLEASAPPQGYVADNTDCNDTDAAIHPGAAEACGDGIDNNCDGQTDQGCYECIDADGDGYCTTVDCDDAGADVNPGSTEICCDYIDNNCDGLIDNDCDCDGQIEGGCPFFPDTGQTTCYDASGNILNPCPSPGQACYGQDPSYTINPPSFTKLDENGRALADNAGGWTMVKDNITGLIWEVKNTTDSSIHDKDKRFTWNNAVNVFIAELNEKKFGGYSDWRLPTKEELICLVNYGASSPSIERKYFPYTMPSSYWSSTNRAYNSASAWLVYFNYGVDYISEKSFTGYVRAVRGGQSSPSFTDNGDGTVTDQATGLMWTRDTAANTMTWQEALAWCANLSLAGHHDWRLPTIKELESIVDDAVNNPAIATASFPDTISSYYWSSTSIAYNTDYAWRINFGNGKNDNDSHKAGAWYVRAVRCGE